MRWRGSDTERLLSEPLVQDWNSWKCLAGIRCGDMVMPLMWSLAFLPSIIGAGSLLAAGL